MAQVGGSVQECSIAGRIFPAASDADVSIKTGGYSNEVQSNGDGTSRMQKTRETPSVEGLRLAIDNNKNDLKFLQDIADGLEFVPFTITLVDGNTWAGEMQITDAPSGSTQSSTAEISLMGQGKLELQ